MTTTVRTERDASPKHERDYEVVLEDIAALSSEALSHMMRESRIAIGYQCDDEWIIEQVRHRWKYFVRECATSTVTLHDAWMAYVKNFHQVHGAWKCSFAGSTDYASGNSQFEVRTYANPDLGWADGYFESGIMRQLGCVFRRNSMSDGFPPAEVIAAIPGYAPLTATFDWVADPGSFLGKRIENWQYVCHPDFDPPQLGEKRHGSFTAYMAVDYDRVDFERDIQPYQLRR